MNKIPKPSLIIALDINELKLLHASIFRYSTKELIMKRSWLMLSIEVKNRLGKKKEIITLATYKFGKICQ